MLLYLKTFNVSEEKEDRGGVLVANDSNIGDQLAKN
jgi:hypothetical protein